jgi:hypothetical protein
MAVIETYKLLNGDLDITGGTFPILEDADAIRSQLEIRLNEFTNDWFLDLNEGVDYFGEVFGKREITDEVENQFKLVILDTQGVTGLDSITFDLDERTLDVAFVYNTIFGRDELSTTVSI